MGTGQGKGNLFRWGWGFWPQPGSFFSSHQSHVVTASEPPILINGHKMPGRQQPPHSVESAMIYGIGALRKKLSELRETSDKWVSVAGGRGGLDGGIHS